MGITWKIHKDANLISFTVFGQSSLLETVDALRDLGADAEFDPAMRRIYVCDKNLESPSGLDTTRGAFVDVLAHQVTKMFDHPATVAFVYGRNNTIAAERFTVTVQMCNMIYAEQGKPPMNHRWFEEVSDALAWLGLPKGYPL